MKTLKWGEKKKRKGTVFLVKPCLISRINLFVISSLSQVLRDDFRLMPIDTSVSSGDIAVLQCLPPRGNPRPTVSWTKDGRDVVSADGRFGGNGIGDQDRSGDAAAAAAAGVCNDVVDALVAAAAVLV